MILWQRGNGMKAAFRRFLRNDAGNIALVFGLLLAPMLGAVGLAVDFGQLLTARTKAQVASDAAALQAAGVAHDLIGRTDGSDSAVATSIAEAKQRAENLFKGYSQQSALDDYTFNVDIKRTGQVINATASYSVTTQNSLASLFGERTFKTSGKSISSSSLPNYVDVYVAMDVSQSMGLGATNADMIALFNATKAYNGSGCVFGCHVSTVSGKISNSELASNKSIKLRIDVLRDAVKKMISTAAAGSSNASIYRFALYGMGATPNNSQVSLPYVYTYSAISGDMTALTATADSITLGFNTTGGVGDSHIQSQMASIGQAITAPGDGTSQAKSKKYFFLITDGVRDTPGWCTSGHCIATVASSYCSDIKSRGITLGVLYTTYLPVFKDPQFPIAYEDNYRGLVLPIASQIAPALQTCASSNWYFEASDATGMTAAIQKMFAQTGHAPAITQ